MSAAGHICPNYFYCSNRVYHPGSALLEGFCFECYLRFGVKLTTKLNMDQCRSCQKPQSFFIQMPSCSHFICSICFQNVHPSETDILRLQLNRNESTIMNNINRYIPKVILTCPLCYAPTIPDWQNKLIQMKTC